MEQKQSFKSSLIEFFKDFLIWSVSMCLLLGLTVFLFTITWGDKV